MLSSLYLFITKYSEEALVEHLGTIQRLHEQRFKVEEQRIRDDASKLEEAKRMALRAEKMRKAKEEEEVSYILTVNGLFLCICNLVVFYAINV